MQYGFVDPHWLVQQVRIPIQQGPPQGRESKAAGETLAIHFTSQHAHGDQPAQILLKGVRAARPMVAALIPVLGVPEVGSPL